MSSLLLAVDPGETTGWAVYDLDAGALIPSDRPRQAPYLEFLLRTDEFSAHFPRRATVVVERFTVTTQTAKHSAQPHALRVTGALEYLAHRDGQDFDATSQPPAAAMKLADNDVLRGLGWYRRGEEHANDALRHVVLWLAREGRIQPSKLLDARRSGALR